MGVKGEYSDILGTHLTLATPDVLDWHGLYFQGGLWKTGVWNQVDKTLDCLGEYFCIE